MRRDGFGVDDVDLKLPPGSAKLQGLTWIENILCCPNRIYDPCMQGGPKNQL